MAYCQLIMDLLFTRHAHSKQKYNLFNVHSAENLGNDSVLDDADTFMSELMKLPTHQLRIECSMFECEAKPCLKEISASLRILDSVITGTRLIHRRFNYLLAPERGI